MKKKTLHLQSKHCLSVETAQPQDIAIMFNQVHETKAVFFFFKYLPHAPSETLLVIAQILQQVINEPYFFFHLCINSCL